MGGLAEDSNMTYDPKPAVGHVSGQTYAFVSFAFADSALS